MSSLLEEPRSDVRRDVAEIVSRKRRAPAVEPPPQTARRRWKKPLLAVSIVAALAAGLWWAVSSLDFSQQDDSLVLYPVSRTDLPIDIVERGNLDSQQKIDIHCELESSAYDRRFNNGAQILFIVPNGTSVKKGDLLVELDSAPLQDLLDNQVLLTERARAQQIQATARLENQLTQNETSLAEAKLRVELAKLELEMYQDEQDGTYQLELQNLDLDIQEAKNKIVESEASLLMQETDLKGIEMLYKLGYRGPGDLKQARVKYLNAEGSLVKATNELSTLLSNRKKKENYERRMQTMELEGKVNTALQALKQVVNNNESMLAQAKASKNAADRELEKEEEKLAKYRAQLEKCKIYAPQDGMVTYAVPNRRSSSSEIAEGAFVRERQHILSLPSLSKMQVKTGVHESVMDKVEPGQPATVRLDAYPDRTYRGKVKSVAVMPQDNGWYGSDTKTYETVVTIEEEVQQLKPGMTAIVEIHVDRAEDVLAVPVQSLLQVKRDTWCYVKKDGDVQRRRVRPGRSNDKFVEVLDGLAQGETVVLNPMTIAESEPQEKSETSEANEDAPEEPTAEQVAQQS